MYKTKIMSFGFKYGLPRANYYFDVGFVKNPARQEGWGFFSPVTNEMVAYVLRQKEASDFMDLVVPLIKLLVTIDQQQIFAFGCSAGRHRSVVIAEEVAKRLREDGIDATISHRDME